MTRKAAALAALVAVARQPAPDTSPPGGTEDRSAFAVASVFDGAAGR